MNTLRKCCLLLSIIVSIGHSQTFSEYGLKMGMVSSKFKIRVIIQNGGSFTYYNDRRNGPTMGMYVRYLDLEYFDLESGLYYLQKGGKDKTEITTINQPDGTGEFLTYDTQFDCLQFLTGFRPYIKSKAIGCYGLISGTLDYLIGVSGTIRPKSAYKDFVLGYVVGAGFEFYNILSKVILLEVLISDTNNVYQDSSIKAETGINYLVRIGFSLNHPKK